MIIRQGLGPAVLWGTLTAGTLDILSAFLFSAMDGRTPMQVLRSVAAGPFGDGMGRAGLLGSLAGIPVHYGIMAVMVLVYMLAARRLPALTAAPVLSGALYGLGLYLVMYWIVLPMRWPALFPQTGWWPLGNALFSHILCVGIPIGLIAVRLLPAPGRLQ